VSLLASVEAVPTLAQLGARLRDETLALARDKSGQSFERYTPWMCVAPVVEAPLEHYELLAAAYEPGELVVDGDYLREVSAFLRGQGQIIFHNVPGDPWHWPIFEEALTERPNTPRLYEQGRELVLGASPLFEALFPHVVEMVIPLSRAGNSGFSTHFARHAIFRTLPPTQTAATTALDISHEMGHQSMMLLQSVDPLIESGHDAPVFSEIRRRDRPAIQSLHAGVALTYMLILARGLPKGDEAQAAISERETQYDGTTLADGVIKSVRSIRRQCQMSDLGEALLVELEDVARG